LLTSSRPKTQGTKLEGPGVLESRTRTERRARAIRPRADFGRRELTHELQHQYPIWVVPQRKREEPQSPGLLVAAEIGNLRGGSVSVRRVEQCSIISLGVKPGIMPHQEGTRR